MVIVYLILTVWFGMNALGAVEPGIRILVA